MDNPVIQMRPYQAWGLHDIFSFFSTRKNGKYLAVSPTATGKTIVQVELLNGIKKQNPNAKVYMITSRVNIVKNHLKALNVSTKGLSTKKVRLLAEKHHVYTYARFRNLLVEDKLEAPDVLIIDEAHHFLEGNTLTDQIWWDIENTKIIGFTATHYRGTPKATRLFLDQWDVIKHIITDKEAVEQGYIVMPEIKVSGVMDDDLLSMRNGNFVISSLKHLDKCAGATFFETILNHIKECQAEMLDKTGRLWPIVVDTPSTAICKDIAAYLTAQGVQSDYMISSTSDKARDKIYTILEKGDTVLCQVNVITEGFDLPDMAVIIDGKPKMSPTAWRQLIGRLQRVSANGCPFKRYICLCRNVERFINLFQGVVPSSVIADAQQQFDTVSSRGSVRVFGNDRLGKLKALPFVLEDRTVGSFYLVRSIDHAESVHRNYAIVLLPDEATPHVFYREDKKTNIDPEKPFKFGTWSRTELPEDFTAYNTVPRRRKQITEKQHKFWKNAAKKVGLLKDANIDGRQFQILPILLDTKTKLRKS